MLVELFVEYGYGSETYDWQNVLVDLEPVTGTIQHTYTVWNMYQYMRWKVRGKHQITYPYGYHGKCMLADDLVNGRVRVSLLNQLNIYPK